MLFIFDLDGTTIDSSHRQNTLPDGSLNLDAWVRNNTPEKIAADSLLPMAESWKTINRQNHQIVIMTARVVGAADFKFLDDNRLGYDYIYSRPFGDTTPDDILKKKMLDTFVDINDVFLVVDDRDKVVKMWRDLGLNTFQVAPGDF